MKKASGVLLFVLCYAQALFAAMGGEIFYTHLTGTNYKVTVFAYRDCSGGYVTGTGLSVIDGKNSNSLNPTVCCGTDITPTCSASCNTCSDLNCNFGFGIQKWLSTATVDASIFKNCDVTFVYEETGGPNTTNVPTVYNIYVQSELNRCTAEHSSPQFQFLPHPFFCVKQPVDMYVSATPGMVTDSLVYHLTPPLYGANKPESYDSSFSYLSPITYQGFPKYSSASPAGFHYDSKTGEFSFIPTQQQSSYIAWEADEYMKDANGHYYLAANTMRMIELRTFAVLKNHPPNISSWSISSHDTIFCCANKPVQFTVLASDSDKTDTVGLSDYDETGGKISYSSTNSKLVTASYSWVPANSYVRAQPYTITFSAMDSKCALYGYAQKRFYIIVKDSLPTTGISITDSGCGHFYFGLKYPINKGYNLGYTWTIDNDTVSKLPSFGYLDKLAGQHIANLTITNNASGCGETYTDTFYYDKTYHTLTSDTGVCKGAAVQLLAAKGSNLDWAPTKGLSDSTIINPIASPDTNTVYTVTGTDANGCAYIEQSNITVSDFKVIISGTSAICNHDTAKLYIKHVPNASCKWSTRSGQVFATGDTILATPNQNTTYYATVSLNNCAKTDCFTVTVNPGGFSGWSNKKICYGTRAQLFVPGGHNYQWIDLIHHNVLGTDSVYNFNAVGIQYDFLCSYMVNATGCADTLAIVVYIGSISTHLSASDVLTCPGQSIKIAAYGGVKYQWLLGKKVVSDSSVLLANPFVSSTYHALVSDTTYHCTNNDSVMVYVSPQSSAMPSRSICKGDTVLLADKGGRSYTWSPDLWLSNTTGAKTIAVPLLSTKYTVEVVDSAVYCTRVDTIPVMVDADCVWPGDANQDHSANYLDVLNIGLGFGTRGPARSAGADQWMAYPASNWNNATGTGVNYKHLDCNGDGLISSADTAIISAHYGLNHNKWLLGTGNPNDPPLYFQFVKDTFYSGDTVTAYLYAGTATNPLKSCYGIGYQANYTANPMVKGSASIQPLCDYFCNGFTLDYTYPYIGANPLDATTVETNRLSSPNGYGKIAVLQFMLLDSLSYPYSASGEKITANLLSATAIDSTGHELNIYGRDGSAIVMKSRPRPKQIDTSTGINAQSLVSQNIRIYPNPTRNQLVVESGNLHISGFRVYNSLGEKILRAPAGRSQTVLDVSALSSGVYVLEIETAQGTGRQSFVVER